VVLKSQFLVIRHPGQTALSLSGRSEKEFRTFASPFSEKVFWSMEGLFHLPVGLTVGFLGALSKSSYRAGARS